MNIQRGDRVAVFLPQRVETAIAHLAAFKLGAISVPLSPTLRGEALAYRLRHSGARLVITDVDHQPHLCAALGEDGEIKIICCEANVPGTESFWNALERVRGARLPVIYSHADDPAILLYTAEPAPRGVLHAHRFLPGRLPALELIHKLQAVPSDRRPFWTPADWASAEGLADSVLAPWLFGCPVLAHRHTKLDPRPIFDLIARNFVRSMFLPPAAIEALRAVENAKKQFALDVFSVHTAGEPFTEPSYQWAAKTFQRVFDLYGRTEVGALLGSSPFLPVRPGSIGKPFPGHSVELLDADNDRVEEGEAGELCVKKSDPGMFLAYFEDPEATKASFTGNYFRTGVFARKDRDGYFWLTERPAPPEAGA
jgi:acetyl-CoA synthetase